MRASSSSSMISCKGRMAHSAGLARAQRFSPTVVAAAITSRKAKNSLPIEQSKDEVISKLDALIQQKIEL